MMDVKKETAWISLGPFYWLIFGLLIHAYYFFQLSLTPGWAYIGDSANALFPYNFQYSGFARGEYPLWNPLNRSGEPLYFIQAFYLANPLSNLTILISLLFGIKNIILSLSIYFFLLTVLYVFGVYFLILVLTHNRFAATFGALIGLASPPVLWLPYTDLFLKLTYAIPWVFYSLIQYHRTFQFKFLTIFVLSLCLVIYSYQLTYALSFLIFVMFSWLIFYWDEISIQKIKKIPIWHIITTTILLCLVAAPMLQIALITAGDYFLPPSSRIDSSTLTVTNALDVKFDLFFDRLPEFFFLRENLIAVIFTGAFWGKIAGEFDNTWTVLRFFLGPLVLPFLGIALFSRRRIVLCIGLSLLLVSSQAGGYFPGNLLYKLPFFNYMKYAYLSNIFLVFSIIILSSVGFDHFFKNRNPFWERILNGFSILLIIGCVILFVALPNRNYSNSALLLTSLTLIAFTSLILLRQKISQQVLMNTVFAIVIVSSISFQYLIKSYHPSLSGAIYKDSNVLKMRNKDDHSLHFLMERPDEIRHWSGEGKPNTSSLADEYYSFSNLLDNSYKVELLCKGLGSYPIVKDYFAFLSLPEQEELLKKKFHFFNRIKSVSMSSYVEKLQNEKGLTKKLLKNKIGIITGAEYLPSPIDVKEDVFDIPEEVEVVNSDEGFRIKIIKYNANSIQLQVTVGQAGLLTYTDNWDRGWHAKINGLQVPVLQSFKIFKGIKLTPGTHEIEFYFKNWILVSFMIMNGVFFVLLFITIGKFLLSIRTVSNS
jgi:hypothetical protein